MKTRLRTRVFPHAIIVQLPILLLVMTGCIKVTINDAVFNGGEEFAEEIYAPRLTEPRLRPLEREDLNEEQVALMEAMPPGFADLNIFKTLVRAPKLIQSFVPLGGYLVAQSTLPARDREILILRTAWNADAEYEWGQHVRIGKTIGLTDDDFERIAVGPDAEGLGTVERTLLAAADELFYDTILHDETWEALAHRYTEEQIIELTFTVGEYTMIAMALNSAGVQLEEGVEGFPED